MSFTLEEVRVIFQQEAELLLASYRTPALMSVKDVSEFLAVSVRTVENMIHDGEIRPLKIGRLRRFDRKMIDAFIRSKTT